MVYNARQHNRTHENVSGNRVFVECKCYPTSGEVEKPVKTQYIIFVDTSLHLYFNVLPQTICNAVM